MAIKKSELYSHIWKSCDELRGGMDASQYKDYVLVLLFLKYVSDKYANKPHPLIDVPEGTTFNDIADLKGDKEIGDKLNKIISKLAEANDLKGVIDQADFNDSSKLGSGKDMQDRVSNLVAIFENPALDFSKNQAGGDDILGDAYEYLIRNFATESGKSKGQFYTPSEVSRVMAKVIDIKKAQSSAQTIYDPTCGSGSLLLKASDETNVDMSLYGQENDNATRALAVMNMWLHGTPTAEIWRGNTLASPYFKNDNGDLKTFDFAVANPPFSYKSWKNGFNPENDEYKRFDGFGIPPTKNGDYAFLLHFIKSLKSSGKGAIILPHGVLFRGNVEAVIRKNIIRRGYIKGIVGLPANLFYGTGIPACIIIIDKENAYNRKGILMIDASKEFFKDGNKNRLREQDIHKIVDAFNKQLEIPKYSRMVNIKEIEENDFNLNIPRYIDSEEEEDLHDIEAHLKGDMPDYDIDKLQTYWDVYPNLKNILFKPSKREGYSQLLIVKDEIKNSIFNHPEFKNYGEEIATVFIQWKNKHLPELKNIEVGYKPGQVIHKLSEDILQAFTGKKLIDKYDVFQHMMNYWYETMKDDIYIIVEDGWKAEVGLIKTNTGKKKGWGCALIPKEIVINRYFADEQENIHQLETESEAILQQIEEIAEEHSGEDGLLEEVINDKGNITKGDLNKRIKEIDNDPEFEDELEVLQEYKTLMNNDSEIKKKNKEAQKELDNKLYEKYKELTTEEIKKIVVDEKWMYSLEQSVKSEMAKISQRLAGRIKELAERYESTLPELNKETSQLEKKVNTHLEKMGFNY